MRFIGVVLVVVFFAWCAYFFYRAYEAEQRADPTVTNSEEHQLAVREAVAEARRLRFLEYGAAAVLMPTIGYILAMFRFPRPSWLRNLLAAFAAFLVVFMLFSLWMEAVFQRMRPGYTLPISVMPTVIMWAIAGILSTIAVLLVAERVHVWRVTK
jgi:hypothetical protein